MTPLTSVLANLDGYYDPLVAMFDHGAGAGFISPVNRAIVTVVTSFDELLGQLDDELPRVRFG